LENIVIPKTQSTNNMANNSYKKNSARGGSTGQARQRDNSRTSSNKISEQSHHSGISGISGSSGTSTNSSVRSTRDCEMNAHVFTTTRVVSSTSGMDTKTAMTAADSTSTTPLRQFVKFATIASVLMVGAICVLAFKIPPVALPLALTGTSSADAEADSFATQLINAGENSRFNLWGRRHKHRHHHKKDKNSITTTIAYGVCGLVAVVGAVIGIMWWQGCACFDDTKYWHLAPYRQTACAGETAITTEEECMTAGMLIRGKVQAIDAVKAAVGGGNQEKMVVSKDDDFSSNLPLGCSIQSRGAFTVIWKGEGDTPAADTVFGVQPICVGKGNQAVDSPQVEISWSYETKGGTNPII